MFCKVLWQITFCQEFENVVSIDIPIDRIEPSKYLIPYIKYIESEPGISRGIPDINVGLFSEGSEKLGLVYNASGIMKEELSSYVGHGWFLNVGGVVTRVVRGLPDDLKNRGYISTDKTDKLLPDYQAATTYQTELLSEIDGVDYEPDIFYFYTKDFYGKFIINKDGEVNLIPSGNVSVTYKKDKDGRIESFEIVPPGGERYCFDKGEEAVVNDGSETFIFTSGWRLSKIRSHADDAVSANYAFTKHKYNEIRVFAEYNLDIVNDRKETGQRTYRVSFKTNMLPYFYGNSQVQMFFNYKGQQRTLVTKDSPSSSGDDMFNYIDSEGYRVDIPLPYVVLEDIKIKHLKKRVLSYDLTFYNNKFDTSSDKPNYKLDSVEVKKIYEGLGINKSISTTQHFNYYKGAGFSDNNNQDLWGYRTGSDESGLVPHTSVSQSVYDAIALTSDIVQGSNRQSNPGLQLCGVLNSMRGSDGTVIKYNFEPNSFTHKGTEYNGAGIRIRSKKIYNLHNSNDFVEEFYSYNNHHSNVSSGVLISYPYVGESVKLSSVGNSVFRIGYAYRGVTHDGVHPVYYNNVAISKRGFGTVRYKFGKATDYIGGFNRTVQTKGGTPETKHVSIHSSGSGLDLGSLGLYNNSKLTLESKHRKGGAKLSEQENIYSNINSKTVKGLRRRFTTTYKTEISSGGSGGGSLPLPGGSTLPDQLFFYTDASVCYYTEYTDVKLLTTQKSRNYIGQNYIETVTGYEYTDNDYNLPLRKIVYKPNGDKLVEQTRFTGSFGNHTQTYKEALDNLNSCLKQYNSEFEYNESTNRWEIKDNKYKAEQEVCYTNYHNAIAAIDGNLNPKSRNPLISEMLYHNNILAPVESITYLEKSNGIKYLVAANAVMYKRHRYNEVFSTSSASNEILAHSKSIVPYKFLSKTGPIKLENTSYVPAYIDATNRLIVDTVHTSVNKEVTRFSKGCGELEWIDINGVYSSNIISDINQSVLMSAQNCNYKDLKALYNLMPYNRHANIPDGAVAKLYEYTDNMLVKSETDINSNKTTHYSYDILDRIVAIYDDEWNVLSYTERNRPGVENAPIICNQRGFNAELVKTVDSKVWNLSNYYHPVGDIVTLNGESVSSDKFLFTKTGLNVVKSFGYSTDGLLISIHTVNVDVKSNPFVKEITGQITDLSMNPTQYLQNRTVYRYDKDDLHMPMIKYKVNGGSGNYDVIIYYEHTDHASSGGNIPQPVGRWIYKTDVKADTYYYLREFSQGKNRYYIWIFDKVLDRDTYTKTPDLITSHKAYFVDYYDDHNNGGTGELPNPLNP